MAKVSGDARRLLLRQLLPLLNQHRENAQPGQPFGKRNIGNRLLPPGAALGFASTLKFKDRMKEHTQKTPSADFLRTDGGKTKSNAIEVPALSLPKGGGALKGIDEKFTVNAVNGTAAFSIPLPFSPARGAAPALSLSYNSGAGNGIFGLGWNLSLGSVKRKSDKGLPQYRDEADTDTYLFSEAEDLVPQFAKNGDGSFQLDADGEYRFKEQDTPDGLHTIRYYQPRIEGLFARIERWTEEATGKIKWRVTSRENVTTLFGWTPNAVVADPQDATRIYEWLPQFVFDDKGNCSQYLYRQEDETGFEEEALHNRNRLKEGKITYTNTYLQKVLYGNKTPYKNFGAALPAEEDYLFQTVFDYGTLAPGDAPDTINDWDYRPDAFSSYKAGFEIRTTRLCKRILLFHVFEELALKADKSDQKTLVKSLRFEYDTVAEPDFTFLEKVHAYGYIKKADGSYSQKQLPPMEFGYEPLQWNKEVYTIAPAEVVHAPAGLYEPDYLFTDLYNEGLNGILTEQAGGWYYKQNLGAGHFTPAQLVTPKPSFLGLGGALQLADLDADGGKQLVSYGQEPKGYFELDDDAQWQPFKSFRTVPNIDFGDRNTRLLDLNGDGKPEVVLSEESVFSWYPSEGREGFSAAHKTPKPYDEETGAALVFADDTQTLFLADMGGDGLTDLVRIRNGEVCYWPNLGWGKFGAKVSLDNAPVFDHPDAFNPAYLRLADIDGSGTTDIIYLGKNRFTCWKNQSGNRFSSTPFEIADFPEIHSQAKVTVTDLLGNGTACIVWSSPLSKDAQAPLKYIDLMGSRKPHLMVGYKNNLGKEVSFEYAPSTRFYLEDKAAGRPWVTRLHFPVHCISKTITEDKITGSRFETGYRYHHGYYDHAEREFRGFGMVEQTDAETFEDWVQTDATNITEAPLHQEPVLSKTWFHTGAFLREAELRHGFEADYWYREMVRQGFPPPPAEVALPEDRIVAAPGIDTSVADRLTAGERQEAARACKGMALRSETFAKDAGRHGNTEAARRRELTPFSVATHNCVVELLQPKGRNKHAVFVVKESEALTYQYERNAADPRIAHTLNLALDEWGNVLQSASVVYPRQEVDASLPAETQQAQGQTHITCSENKFTNDVITETAYRLRLPAEVKTFELRLPDAFPYELFHFEGILTNAKSDAVEYPETDVPLVAGKPQRRLIEHIRSTYYRNNLTGALPLYQLESLALPFESYQQAYTPALLQDIFAGKADAPLMEEGKFTHSAGDANWWIRSGSTQFIAGAETAAAAQDRFYLPQSYTEPYGGVTRVKYDGDFFLFISETEDPLGNKAGVETFDFRTLSPRRMRDINGNFSEVLLDELGLVKAVAVMGKGTEADQLTGLSEITEGAENTLIQDFFEAPDSVALTTLGKDLLKGASSRFVYDFEAYLREGKPAVVASVTREQHFAQQPDSPVQIAFEYSDGLGKVTLKKVQAEPGLAKKVVVQAGNTIDIVEVDTSTLIPKQLRWIGNGRTVLNNKGNPIKQYEPYFSVTHRYEDLKELVETGVTPVLYYDAPGRRVRTELPDGTFTKVEFDAWKQQLYDANDTVLDSDWYLRRTDNSRPDFITDLKEQQAAAKAAPHYNTPTLLHFDTLGRPILSIDHHKNGLTGEESFYETRIQLDIEGNLRTVTDARHLPENGNSGNMVMQYKYDMLGNNVYQESMDAGRRWLLLNILGNPLRTWDERNQEFRFSYDIAHRPTQTQVIGGDGPTPLNHIFGKLLYGESLLSAGRANEAALQAQNVLGKAIEVYDTGGRIETPAYNFKGAPVATTRRLFRKYKEVANWTDANLEADLETASFTFKTATDALGRIAEQTAPDLSLITPAYNEAGTLNSEAVLHPGAATVITYIQDIDYNEKGQREKIVYGNGVTTRFYYDRETFRLKRLQSRRQNGDPLQDWHYTYDPVGNITHIEDQNVPVVFFDNQKITGLLEYTYDSLYRLVEAKGRENDAALHFGASDNWNDKDFLHFLNAGDPVALRNYTQSYRYDEAGNITELKHLASGNNWTRTYDYSKTSNRLEATQVGAQTYAYPHHPEHGFITALPHLHQMGWNFKEELVQTAAQHRTDGGTPETTYYQYDGGGQRIRKITENEASAGTLPTRKEERIYIAGYELYRKHSGAHAGLERSSLSLLEEGHRFVMVETRNDVDDGTEAKLVRYQLHNHLGSAALELDATARVISYEEYHPFGTTAYQATNAAIRSAGKRYRYTGMERDEETGLEYHSARYYLPWLGRWLSSDPIGIGDGVNVYEYVKNNPTRFVDRAGSQSEEPSNWNRAMGGLRMIGGGFEMVAGGSLFTAGLATSEFGIGLLGVAGGAAVVAHGGDTASSGLAMLISGRDIDTYTSQGLQAAGMERSTANLTDAGIGLVTTLGASTATRAPAFAREGINLASPAITVSHAAGAPSAAGVTNPIGYAIGHTRVGVTLGDGTATVWSHLTVPETGRVMMAADTLVSSGNATVSTGVSLVPKFSSTATVPVSAAEARSALTFITEAAPMTAAQAGEAGILTTREVARAGAGTTFGRAGDYALFGNDCASYGGSVLQSAGVSATGSTPSTLFISTALRSEAPATTILTSPLVTGVTSSGGAVTNGAVVMTRVPAFVSTNANASISSTTSSSVNECIVPEEVMSSSMDYSQMVCR